MTPYNREIYENQYLSLCIDLNKEIDPNVFLLEDVELLGVINRMLEGSDCLLITKEYAAEL